ncbi:hypothetical protein IFO70_28705 [Phormidium tenue FACHB-886]|nr:hypothetical protein [Phormidium tenue FACHB-886]
MPHVPVLPARVKTETSSEPVVLHTAPDRHRLGSADVQTEGPTSAKTCSALRLHSLLPEATADDGAVENGGKHGNDSARTPAVCLVFRCSQRMG